MGETDGDAQVYPSGSPYGIRRRKMNKILFNEYKQLFAISLMNHIGKEMMENIYGCLTPSLIENLTLPIIT